MTDATLRYANDPPSALPRGTRLGEFELVKVIGIGGFGIVYEAFDHALERDVAVKEYMPASLAGRTETMHVTLRSKSDAETFALGLKSFINEARLLARFDLPSLIRVHRFWEANGTAYMAMPLLRGKSVKALRQAMTAPPDEAWLRALLGPMLSTLDALHAEGVYHRDISPDNIHLEADGRPVLLDLGAARRVIGDATQTLTAILKPAYAPIEQYAEIGGVRQGPWTDLYSLGATLHYLLLGRPPAPATARTISDEQPPLALQNLPGVSLAFAQVVDWMLAPRPDARPRSVAMVRDALDGLLAPPERTVVQPVAPVAWERTQLMPGGAGSRTVAPAGAAVAGSEGSAAGADVDLTQLTAASGMTAVPGTQTGAVLAPAPQSAPQLAPQGRPAAAPAPAKAAGADPAAAGKPAGRPWLWLSAAGVAALVVGVLALRGGGSEAPEQAEPLAAAPPPSLAPASAAALPVPPAVQPAAPVQAAPTGPAAQTLAGDPAAVGARPSPNGTGGAVTPASTVASPSVATPPAPSTGPTAATVQAPRPATSRPAPTQPQRSAGTSAAPATSTTTATPIAPTTRPATGTAPAAAAVQRPPAATRPAPAAQAATDPGLAAAPAPADTQRTPAATAATAAAPATALPTLPTLPPGQTGPAQVVNGPFERCGRRVLLAQWTCVQRECAKPELRSHPDCIKWLKDQEAQSQPQY